jgi:hypothetical protein
VSALWIAYLQFGRRVQYSYATVNIFLGNYFEARSNYLSGLAPFAESGRNALILFPIQGVVRICHNRFQNGWGHVLLCEEWTRALAMNTAT